jgi:hypothetical protein
MNSPCVRIEIIFEDGSKKIAVGKYARVLLEWLDRWCPASVQFHPAILDVGGESQRNPETEVRGGGQ